MGTPMTMETSIYKLSLNVLKTVRAAVFLALGKKVFIRRDLELTSSRGIELDGLTAQHGSKLGIQDKMGPQTMLHGR